MDTDLSCWLCTFADLGQTHVKENLELITLYLMNHLWLTGRAYSIRLTTHPRFSGQQIFKLLTSFQTCRNIRPEMVDG